MATESMSVPLVSGDSLTQRILSEGEMALPEACREAGLRQVPHIRFLMRQCIAGKLEAIKIAGRWRTSSAAVVRWLEAKQARRAAPPPQRADANAVLGRYGLQRDA